MKRIVLGIVVLGCCLHEASATVYLDGAASGCADGATNYQPTSRSCGSGTDTVYLNLTSFSAGIVPGATHYVRAGNHFRDDVNGSLYIGVAKAGSAGNYTTIKAYPGEERQAVIGTVKRGATYNSNPADPTGAGSWNYYPNVAVAILADYVELNGIKTYGEVSTNGANYVRIVNNDLGGGGPATSGQGAVLKLEHVTDGFVSNNLIHRSCLAVDSTNNGPGVILYDANATLTQNTFFDNFSGDIYAKDSGVQGAGRKTEISYNFFRPSAIRPGSNPGVMGHNQDVQVAEFLIHHNVFLGKSSGYAVMSGPAVNRLYSNTFVNCGTDVDNSAGGGPHPIVSQNNLFYHATNQTFAALYMDTGTVYSDYLAASNWNVFYNNGSKWGKSAPGALTWETTLAGWQSRTGLDGSSIVLQPGFVNAAGTSAADFRRSALSENFVGSPYGSKAGAYVTGLEQVGATASGSVRPLSPRNLSVH